MTNCKDRVRTIIEAVNGISSYYSCYETIVRSEIVTPLRSCEFPIDEADLAAIEAAVNERLRIVQGERTSPRRENFLNELGRAMSAIDYRKRCLGKPSVVQSYGPFKERHSAAA